ncbi:MAG: hypothetical protein V3V33_05045 [Candidatus Lokiarchaeia archaeon]
MPKNYIKSAKKDILSFFYDDERKHWIYKYRDNLKSNVDGRKVFYLQQLKVLFENEYSHWNTGIALNELVGEGQLIKWNEYITVGTKKKKRKLSLFRRPDVRYYIKNAKTILEHNKSFDTDFGKTTGKWAEFLTEHMFLKFGFKIIDSHTNKFKNQEWKKTKNNLDFIVSKDDLYYGVEVKNRFEYITEEEFEIKMFGICKHLNLIPMCVFRMAPRAFTYKLYKIGGFTLIYKRKVLPIGFEKYARKIWEDTLLPIQASNFLSEKAERLFLKWHEKHI